MNTVDLSYNHQLSTNISKINYPNVITLNNGKEIQLIDSDLYITKTGIYDFRINQYIICIFRTSTNIIRADVCFKGISTYSDFDSLDLSKDRYDVLNELN